MAEVKWRDAIRRVLQEAEEPTHYTDIAQSIIDNGYRTKVGATPAATVAAQLGSTSLAGEVTRVERGVYQLKTKRPAAGEGVVADNGAAQEVSTPPIDQIADVEYMGLINAFGMYWRRSAVEWATGRPNLWGAQQSGSEHVNFAEQAGIYLLHDGSRTVYVGRVTKHRMGTRLWEHTRDRLSGRWDRFSWFGIRSVGEDGRLGEGPGSGIDVETLIATMEALMIEGLEPPQNRRQGDRFNALEFIQVVDPNLERQRLIADLSSALSGG